MLLDKLSEIEVYERFYGAGRYRVLTIGEQNYMINDFRVIKGEPGDEAEKLPISMSGTISFSSQDI